MVIRIQQKWENFFLLFVMRIWCYSVKVIIFPGDMQTTKDLKSIAIAYATTVTVSGCLAASPVAELRSVQFYCEFRKLCISATVPFCVALLSVFLVIVQLVLRFQPFLY